MAKQRDAIRMSEAEVAAFIESRKSVIVATLDKDGAPHQTVLWFAMVDGDCVFETYGTSQKVVNLRRDPRISLMWEAGETYDELRGVSVRGRAEIIDSEPALSELMRACVRRNHPEADPTTQEARVGQMVRKRVVVRVHAEKTLSWDHGKIASTPH